MKTPLSRKRFESLLKKAAQPKKKSDQSKTRTSESHPSDGYTDTSKSQDIPEGKEG